MQKFVQKTTAILGSRRFFNVVLGVFVLQALWFVVSAVYPMAFDEDFHFGIIKIYSHHWLPFLASQPPNANAFGAVARDPSYLYHYLMSFPYRLIELVCHGQTSQVIALRLINVALFAGSLVLFRRVLLRVGTSPALANVSLVLFTLIPIVPQLAAHINYDNLLMPLVAWTLLLAFRAIDELRERRVDMRTLLMLLIVCIFTSLVKYAFLPIFMVTGVYLVAVMVRSFWGDLRQLWPSIRAGFLGLGRLQRIVLSVLLLVALGMFWQRDGSNAVQYKTPVPSCSDVLSTDECSAYGPWGRNYQASLTKAPFDANPAVYTVQSWLFGLWYRLFFAVSGPASDFRNYPPLPLPGAASICLGLVGLVVVAAMVRRIFGGQSKLLLLFFIFGAYSLALWLDEYEQFLQTGQPVAINGRYLVPVLLLAAAIIGRGLSLLLARYPGRRLALATFTILLFLQGGGVLTFISRSDASWDWPNQTVINMNDAARRVLAPVLVEGSKERKTAP